MNSKKSLNDVVDDLIPVIGKILEYKAGVALGEEPPEESHKFQKKEMDEILKLATPLIQGVQASRQITANTSAEVVVLLSNGKVTPTEAVALLKLVKEKVDVEKAELEQKLRKELIDE